MDIISNSEVREIKNSSQETVYYILVCRPGFVYLDKSQEPKQNAEGEEYLEYTTAIGMTPTEYEKINTLYECVEHSDGMIVY